MMQHTESHHAILIGLFCLHLSASTSTIAVEPPQEWTFQYGTTEHDFGYRVAVDRRGGVFAVGTTLGAFPGHTNNGEGDAFLVKYVPGQCGYLWSAQWGDKKYDWARGVAVDQYGNVFVSGTTVQPDSGRQASFLRKYSSGGRLLLARQFQIGKNDFVQNCVLGSRGNVYVIGRSSAENGTILYVAKFNRFGTHRWTSTLGGTPQELPVVGDLTLDENGNIYVTGYASHTLNGQPVTGRYDAFLAKLSTDGKWEWVNLTKREGSDYGQGVTIGHDGLIYMAGWRNETDAEAADALSDQQPGAADFNEQVLPNVPRQAAVNKWWVVAWSTDGKIVRELDLGRAGGVRSAITADDGNLFLAGAYESALVDPETGTIKWYQRTGWMTLGTAQDRWGGLYVTGAVNGSLPGQPSYGGVDLYVIKFAEADQQQPPAAGRPTQHLHFWKRIRLFRRR